MIWYSGVAKHDYFKQQLICLYFHTTSSAAHLRSLSLLLCLSLRWISDIWAWALFLLLPLPDSPAESGAAEAALTGWELWVLACFPEGVGVSTSSVRNTRAYKTTLRHEQQNKNNNFWNKIRFRVLIITSNLPQLLLLLCWVAATCAESFRNDPLRAESNWETLRDD